MVGKEQGGIAKLLQIRNHLKKWWKYISVYLEKWSIFFIPRFFFFFDWSTVWHDVTGNRAVSTKIQRMILFFLGLHFASFIRNPNIFSGNFSMEFCWSTLKIKKIVFWSKQEGLEWCSQCKLTSKANKLISWSIIFALEKFSKITIRVY